MEQFDVSEIFYSLQGEGPSTGVPSVFIRLANCNLQCGGPGGELMKLGKASWFCDSESVWRTSTKMSAKQIVEAIINSVKNVYHEKNRDSVESYIENSVHMIFTGGEPMLPKNKKAILETVKELNGRGLYPYCELETSGSLPIGPEIHAVIDQINCSPKLQNSGMSAAQRIRPDVMKELTDNRAGQVYFKFVVSNDSDWDEIVETYVKPFNIPYTNIFLMPGVDNRSDLAERTRFVWELAMKAGVNCTSRLHVLAFDKLVGV